MPQERGNLWPAQSRKSRPASSSDESTVTEAGRLQQLLGGVIAECIGNARMRGLAWTKRRSINSFVFSSSSPLSIGQRLSLANHNDISTRAESSPIAYVMRSRSSNGRWCGSAPGPAYVTAQELGHDDAARDWIIVC